MEHNLAHEDANLTKRDKCTIQPKNFSAEVREYESNPSNETVRPKKTS
jgi:hypothetical protein